MPKLEMMLISLIFVGSIPEERFKRKMNKQVNREKSSGYRHMDGETDIVELGALIR